MRLYREVVQLQPGQSFRAWSPCCPYRTARWHFHPEYEVHLVTATSGHAFVGDHAGRFAPGNLALLGPNLPHNWISDTPTNEIAPHHRLVVQFPEAFIRRCIEAFPELRSLVPVLEESLGGLDYPADASAQALELMTALTVQESAGQEATGGAARMAWFFGLMRIMATSPGRRRLSSPDYRPCARNYVHDALEHVLLHIERNLDADLSESDMAALSGYTQSSFSRAFHRQVGQPFIRYVNHKRIARACGLLQNLDRGIQEVCFAVGFKNVSNFNRQFLSHTGMTPSAWRRAHRQPQAGLTSP